jgi:aerobic-type carbon monoxide dehydrogenase small subunit (CoxS/CutS family)
VPRAKTVIFTFSAITIGLLKMLALNDNSKNAARMHLVKLTVNGKPYEFLVKPNTTLRDLLRNGLGLTSTKDMCHGVGACGSCSVILDGRPVLSCLTLAVDCDGKTVETAEGIANSNHPIFEAYTKYHTMQCGYCTPGFVVTAKALLDRNPNPTEEDIREALGGNICRCGTYPEHIKAVKYAAKKLGAIKDDC